MLYRRVHEEPNYGKFYWKIPLGNGGDDSLLNMETYTLTSASDTVRHYEYIFTEDFFNNGKPIE